MLRRRARRVGLCLSITSISALVFTIIEAPEYGWLSPFTLGGFAISAALIASFVSWELRVEHPLLPVRIFENLRFSAASVSVTSAFFALFGFVFLITQYFQLIRGYTPLQAGVRTLPVAFSIALASVLSPADPFDAPGIFAAASRPPFFYVGSASHDLRDVARDLAPLAGKKRAWILLSSTWDDAFVRQTLDCLGRRLDERRATRAVAYLYDLSRRSDAPGCRS